MCWSVFCILCWHLPGLLHHSCGLYLTLHFTEWVWTLPIISIFLYTVKLYLAVLHGNPAVLWSWSLVCSDENLTLLKPSVPFKFPISRIEIATSISIIFSLFANHALTLRLRFELFKQLWLWWVCLLFHLPFYIHVFYSALIYFSQLHYSCFFFDDTFKLTFF